MKIIKNSKSPKIDRVIVTGAVLSIISICFIYFFQLTRANIGGYILVFIILIILLISALKAVLMRAWWNVLIAISPLMCGFLFVTTGAAGAITYGGFLLERYPLVQYNKQCIRASEDIQSEIHLAFCERVSSFWSEPRDIFYDISGQIAQSNSKWTQEWVKQFKDISQKATSSELFQVSKIESIDRMRLNVKIIGHGYYQVSYPLEF